MILNLSWTKGYYVKKLGEEKQMKNEDGYLEDWETVCWYSWSDHHNRTVPSHSSQLVHIVCSPHPWPRTPAWLESLWRRWSWWWQGWGCAASAWSRHPSPGQLSPGMISWPGESLSLGWGVLSCCKVWGSFPIM